jgi:hypothetical protein
VPASVGAVVGHAEEPDPAGRQQLLVKHLLVVGADLGRRGPRVKAGVRPVLVDHVTAELPGVDAVQGRRRVQAHERVRVIPVAARTVAPVYQHDVGVAVRDERVGERHASGACADDQVIGLDCGHCWPPR